MSAVKSHEPRSRARAAAPIALLLALSALTPAPAFALSEIPQEEVAPAPEITTVPLPAPLPNPGNTGAEPSAGEPAPVPDGGAPAEEPAAIPEIQYDLSLLPEPVRQLRERILEACRTGDIEALRPMLVPGEEGTLLSFGGVGSDPIQFLKELSGDGEGHEILAILAEVLEAGYVHLEQGTDGEIYVWPYFFAVPLDSLTAPQRVELFRLVTAGDYEDMKNYGAYIFYRVGIMPDGKWVFFVAGD
jgi:hypothetical protein